ncbi:MAG: flagellar motor protein MotB [Actinomycetota bacterium]
MARKQKCPEVEQDNFMTTYADMVTLLMAFFVLLFAMSTVDEAKFIVLLKGLEENFGNATLQSGVLNGGESILGANLAAGSAIPVPGGSLFLEASDQVLENGTEEGAEAGNGGTTGTEESGPEPDPEDPPPPVEGEPDDAFLDREELRQLQERLESILEQEGRRDDVNFRFDERGLVISVATDDVLFASGSSELNDADGVLEVIAPEIATFPNAVFVDGHTDDIPFPGLDFTNRDLSAERALAVAAELERNYGIAPDRLIPAGYGEWRPIADNSTEEGRAVNRRVELVIAADQTGSVDGFLDDPDAPESAPTDTPEPAPADEGAASDGPEVLIGDGTGEGVFDDLLPTAPSSSDGEVPITPSSSDGEVPIVPSSSDGEVPIGTGAPTDGAGS